MAFLKLIFYMGLSIKYVNHFSRIFDPPCYHLSDPSNQLLPPPILIYLILDLSVILPPFQWNLYVSHLLPTITLPVQTGFTSEFTGLDWSSYCVQEMINVKISLERRKYLTTKTWHLTMLVKHTLLTFSITNLLNLRINKC